MIKRFIEKLKTLRLYFVSGSCKCGKMRRCPRKVKVGNNGDFWVENHFDCKSIQEFNNKMNNWFDNYH